MSNYLQSKLIFSHLILCSALLSSHALAAEPASHSKEAMVNDKKGGVVFVEDCLSAARIQIEKLSKNIARSKSNETKEKAISLSKEPIPVALKDSVINPLRNLIYDPEHPAELFNKLIAGYSIYLSAEKQCMSLGESLLGKDNTIIIRVKQNYKADVLYLEALKQQKLMLEKSGKNK